MDYNNVWSLINKAEKSKRAMAKIVGMSAQGFNTMMDNKTMSVDVIEKIANHFKLPLSYFFDTEVPNITTVEPKVTETGCLKCIDKNKRIEELTKELKNREYIISVQEDLINEYKTQLGKNVKAS